MAEPTYEELKARLSELEKQQGTRRSGSLEFRVGEKGGVSVYGLGRFPVTLYYEQWIRLLDSADKLRQFHEENKPKLKLKDQSFRGRAVPAPDHPRPQIGHAQRYRTLLYQPPRQLAPRRRQRRA